eukprot:gene5608-7742_t
MSEQQKSESSVNVGDLVPFHAACCSITSCYWKFPECFGVYGQGDCCCLQGEFKLCKPGGKKSEHLCVCSEVGYYLVRPTTCCKSVQQCFCLDSRIAFPCDSDVPCMFTYCFITCCFNWKCVGCQCGKTVQELGGGANQVIPK